jgi:phospholipase C
VVVQTRYGRGDHGAVELRITNTGKSKATAILVDAYTGDQDLRFLRPGETLETDNRCDRFYGWYDFVIKVNEDSTFERRVAGHVETGEDSFSDPALGGLVKLKA